MTSFANAVLTVLLSWVSGVASTVWGFLNGETSGGLISWLGDHWILLAGILLAIGIVIDLTVYVLRWRPNRVWATFFRHLRGEWEDRGDVRPETIREQASEDKHHRRVRRWIYADGSAREELLPEEEPTALQTEKRRRRASAYDLPTESEVSAGAEPARRRRRSDGQPQERRVSRLHRLLNEKEETYDFRYNAAPTAGSKDEKYRQPYIPPQYHRPEEKENP